MSDTPAELKVNGLEDARAELARRGIQYSEEHFLRYVRTGNTEIVALYLGAGISPNAGLDGESALAAAANCGHKPIIQLLIKAGANPAGLIDGLKIGQNKKDTWEKLASLAGVFTFVSSLVVAGLGWYFTYAYNERQLEWTRAQAARDQETKEYQNRLAEMQTVEKMIPHLTRNETSKQAALIAISALASPKLAARIAEAYGGQGSIDALAQLATNTASQPAAPAIAALTNIAKREQDNPSKPAHEALARVFSGKEKAIVKLMIDGSAVCNGFIVDSRRGWVVSAAYCIPERKSANIIVQLEDNSRVPVLKTTFSQDRLLTFLQIEKQGLAELPLAKIPLNTGSSVTQIAFSLDRNQLGVVLGRVVESGVMPFPAYTGTAAKASDSKVGGLKVILAAEEKALVGTGGGPLLDSEGNVACMTYMSDSKRMEQCIAAEVISTALKALQLENPRDTIAVK